MRRVFASPQASEASRWAFGVWAGLVLALPVFGQALTPGGRADTPAKPAATSDSTSLARYIPDGKFTFYTEFQGLDVHRASWQKSAAYKVLNGTSLGALLSDLAAQGVDAAAGGAKGRVATGADVVAKAQLFVRRGAAVGITMEGPGNAHIVAAFRGGAAPDARGLLDALAASMGSPKGSKADLRKGSRAVTQYGEGANAIVIWAEKADAVLCDLASLDAVLDAIDGKKPSAESNATRIALTKTSAVYEPVGLAFLDVTKVGPLPPQVAEMGLDRLKAVEFRVGFQGDALMSVIRLVAPSPRTGALSLFDQPTFDVTSLPPIPAGLTGFTVLSLDLGKTHDLVTALIKQSDPARGAARVDQATQSLNAMLGIDLRRDLLPYLGPKFLVYNPAVAAPGSPQPSPVAGFMGLTIGAQVKDPRAAKGIEAVMHALGEQLKSGPPGRGGQQGPEFRQQKAKRSTWTLSLPAGGLPPGIEPTLVVGKNWLALSARRNLAEAAVDLAERGGTRWVPGEAYMAMARQLPKNLMMLNVNDPRESFPALVTSLPSILQQINAGMAQGARPGGRNGAPPQLPVRIDPALMPKSDDLARSLAPGSYYVSTEPDGIRFVIRESFPSLVSPGVGGVAVGLLLPAVQAAREAARRTQCSNNERQIGLALINYSANKNFLPKPAITDKNGKPLLSWRVAILPLLDENALYNKFHLDEPWDSPHNKGLLQSMPSVYACASAGRSEPGMTNYRVFTGKSTLFDPGATVTPASVKDGFSNTIAVVETRDGVPWTKPEDLPFDPDQPPTRPMYGAGSSHPGGFNALFADGSVRFVRSSITMQTLSALITRNGGEVTDSSDY